jgi:excisionase family DNA binding protein
MPQELDLLTLQQAARKTGRSEKTLRRLISCGSLPADKSTGRYLIRPADLEACICISLDVLQQLEGLQARVVVIEQAVAELQPKRKRRVS